MNILCKLFGHRPGVPSGYGLKFRDSDSYFAVIPAEIDGMGVEHAILRDFCVRCSVKFQVGRIHLPKVRPVAWRPIHTAPLDGTMVLLGYFIEGDLRSVDYGCFEWIENSDWDGQPVYDWSSLNGMEEPTHWLPAPVYDASSAVEPPPEDRRHSDDLPFGIVFLNDNGEDDSDEAYAARTEALKTSREIIEE